MNTTITNEATQIYYKDCATGRTGICGRG
jgi:hypothetical protein